MPVPMRRKPMPPPAWLKPGARVDYRSLRSGPVTHANREVLSEPWKLGSGDWIVSIEGVSGGVSVEHLALVSPAPAKGA